jgi:hypothetical protein
MEHTAMTYRLSEGDKGIVYNIRFKHKDAVAQYSDELIAYTWREFSSSEEYPDEDKFLEWLQIEQEIAANEGK